MLLAIDPGITACGASLFDGTELYRAGYVKNLESPKASRLARLAGSARGVLDWCRFAAVTRIIFEWPQIRRDERIDLNDLLLLSGIGGAIAAIFGCPASEFGQPSEWKGTILAEECVRRVQERLTPVETARVELPAPSYQHNVWDSVGIALKYVGRFERHRVYPR